MLRAKRQKSFSVYPRANAANLRVSLIASKLLVSQRLCRLHKLARPYPFTEPVTPAT